MKRVLKLMTLVMLAVVMTVSLLPAAQASGGKTIRVTSSNGSIWMDGKNSSDYTACDLFDDSFKKVVPGDVCEGEITLENYAGAYDYVVLSLRAVPHDESNPLSEATAEKETIESNLEFLDQLKLEVTFSIGSKDTVIYSGTAGNEELSKLSSGIDLCKFSYGQKVKVKVKVTIPAEMTSEYAGRIGEIDWKFSARGCSTGPLKMTVEKKWENNGEEIPESVTVILLDDETIYDSVELNEANGWKYTWDNPDVEGSWRVYEKSVPHYKASYTGEDGYVLITNTYGQVMYTGENILPIICFAVVGLCMIAAGILLVRKNRKQENK